MVGYRPLKITGPETGLVQEREDFLLPIDGFPKLENAYCWRGKIIRKSGYKTLGCLGRSLIDVVLHTLPDPVPNPYTIPNILSSLSEPNATIKPGQVTLVIDAGGASETIYEDDGLGNLVLVSGPYTINPSTINYASGEVVFNWINAPSPGETISSGDVVSGGVYYCPHLPVMGIRLKELNNISLEDTIFFDTKYAYKYGINQFSQTLGNTTWTGTDSDFFWTINYWVDKSDGKLFWITNFSDNDPIRYTNGGNDAYTFDPNIDGAPTPRKLQKALILLPFRGRLLALNTFEGTALNIGRRYRQRIRWSAIGTPITVANTDVTAVNPQAWREDVIGQGGFLDIPTAEDIITAGFVRDNLVIYCERSTWQLRYTGRSIAPFQIERVNSELGAESTFSAINFDTSLVGVGDKGIVECDSFKSERIDSKIPDLVFRDFHNDNNGQIRVHGIRDITKRLAYWIYPKSNENGIYPNRRLLLNYEEGSWAIFKDSLTALGPYQAIEDRRWQDVGTAWNQQGQLTWLNRQSQTPLIAGGNQQGYISILDTLTTNQEAFYIKSITADGVNATVFESPNHNLSVGDIIEIKNIPTGTGYDSLNDVIYRINSIPDSNEFTLSTYNQDTKAFSDNVIKETELYVGIGEYRVIDNFSIKSKKFDHMDEGQKIQLGHIDILTQKTEQGQLTLKLYSDYQDDTEMNKGTDPFFNTIIRTTQPNFTITGQSKYWHRVFCNIRSNLIQMEYTLSDEQMNGEERESNLVIDAQILYERAAGRIGI